ncbi:Uncharacterised protein [Bacillus freudenreichii]|nr:Uncharacterised protein [Bacillus freudenreichii]
MNLGSGEAEKSDPFIKEYERLAAKSKSFFHSFDKIDLIG